MTKEDILATKEILSDFYKDTRQRLRGIGFSNLSAFDTIYVTLKNNYGLLELVGSNGMNTIYSILQISSNSFGIRAINLGNTIVQKLWYNEKNLNIYKILFSSDLISIFCNGYDIINGSKNNIVKQVSNKSNILDEDWEEIEINYADTDCSYYNENHEKSTIFPIEKIYSSKYADDIENKSGLFTVQLDPKTGAKLMKGISTKEGLINIDIHLFEKEQSVRGIIFDLAGRLKGIDESYEENIETGLQFEIVDSLPDPSEADSDKIYLKPFDTTDSGDDYYEAWIIVTSDDGVPSWKRIGSNLNGYAKEEWVKDQIRQAELTDKDIDLSDYATKLWVKELGFLTECLSGQELNAGLNIYIKDDNISALGYTYDSSKKSITTGIETIASGKYSHAEGYGVLCSITNVGSVQYNLEDGDLILLNDGKSHVLAEECLLLIEKELTGLLISTSNLLEIDFKECFVLDSNNHEITYDLIDDEETYSLFYPCHDTIKWEELNDIKLIVPLTASNQASHAEGKNTLATGKNSHSEGLLTFAEKDQAHAEGHMTQALGINSHAEGLMSVAEKDQAHAEGWRTKATGKYSHAEGRSTTAEGSSSHAEGKDCVASGNNSHAEGQRTIASGHCSHAEGIGTEASGEYSHASGEETKATRRAQTVVGEFNKTDDYTLFIVGGGNSDSDRRNAFSVFKNENINKLPSTLTALVNNIDDVYVGLPIGSVVMWPGNQIPVGWLVCGVSEILLTDGSLGDYDFTDGSQIYLKCRYELFRTLAKILNPADILQLDEYKKFTIPSLGTLPNGYWYIIKYM